MQKRREQLDPHSHMRLDLLSAQEALEYMPGGERLILLEANLQQHVWQGRNQQSVCDAVRSRTDIIWGQKINADTLLT